MVFVLNSSVSLESSFSLRSVLFKVLKKPILCQEGAVLGDFFLYYLLPLVSISYYRMKGNFAKFGE